MRLSNTPVSLLNQQPIFEDSVSVSYLRRLVKIGVAATLVGIVITVAIDRLPVSGLVERVSWFHLRDITVSAGWPIQVEQVRQWLPAMEGKSLLLIRSSEIARALKEKPWVEWVTLKKEFPDRLVIEVGTKRAVAIEVTRGQSYFIDELGNRIERATSEMLKALDLPVVSREEGSSGSGAWSLDEIAGIVDKMTKFLDPRYAISEVVLSAPPLFRIYFTRPRLAVTFSAENWETQLPVLALLLHSPPRQIGQPRKINLVLPKKAIVSSHLSH